VSDHVRYSVLRTVGLAKGWLDRERWVEANGRHRIEHLLTLLAEAQVARLWVGVRDMEDGQVLADWWVLFEDPEVWLEWLNRELEKLGHAWDDVMPYGGDNR
jgi:hypothetical protein